METLEIKGQEQTKNALGDYKEILSMPTSAVYKYGAKIDSMPAIDESHKNDEKNPYVLMSLPKGVFNKAIEEGVKEGFISKEDAKAFEDAPKKGLFGNFAILTTRANELQRTAEGVVSTDEFPQKTNVVLLRHKDTGRFIVSCRLHGFQFNFAGAVAAQKESWLDSE